MKKLLFIPVLLILASCYNVEQTAKILKQENFVLITEVDGVTKNNYFKRSRKLKLTMEDRYCFHTLGE
jgi:hypothetical protein